jgi:hypothetical protein
MTLLERVNHMRGLSAQIGVIKSRLVYAKAATLFAATVLEDHLAIVDHMAYWAPLRAVEEGRYLSAILNCDAVRRRIAPMQLKDQGGARHFDNLIWELPIPEFDRRDALHAKLAAAAAEAERVAAAVPLDEGTHFTRQRRAIRDALIASGIGARIDALVARLLGP